MKYRTFAKIRAVAVIGVIGLSGFGLYQGCGARHQETAQTAQGNFGNTPDPNLTAVDAPPVQQNQNPPTDTVDTGVLTNAQKEIIELHKQPLSKGVSAGDSVKWVVQRPGYKTEFRSDTSKGFHIWNRVKIDTNGNKRYEEKWDFRPDGSIKRRVAPNDDENYTQEYTLKGNVWTPK